jgi:hypothetical protein
MSTTTAYDPVSAIRREIMTEIEAAASDAYGQLEAHGALVIAPPRGEIGGEWNWYWHLSQPERQRIRRNWVDSLADGPDVIADRYHANVDEAMSDWLRCTRVVDYARWLRTRPRHMRGGPERARRVASVGGHDLDDLFPHPLYRLSTLFAVRVTCEAYLTELTAQEDEEREEAAQWRPSAVSTSTATEFEPF